VIFRAPFGKQFGSEFSVFSSQILVVGFPGMVLGSEYFLTNFSVGNLGFLFH
jgi:hypothetical protein